MAADGRSEEAVAAWGALCKALPDDAAAHQALANLYAALRHPADEERELAELARLRPRDSRPLRRLAALARARGDAQTAKMYESLAASLASPKRLPAASLQEMIAALFLIMGAVLVLPFAVKKVEHNLELFLLAMGLAAALVSRVLDAALVQLALVEPLPITAAVLVAGALFKALRFKLRAAIEWTLGHVPLRVLIFMLVAALGLLSSLIAIIASLVLVELVSALRLDRDSEIWLTVMACFTIGLGAALTPIGEPLHPRHRRAAPGLLVPVAPSVVAGDPRRAGERRARGLSPERKGEGLGTEDVLESWGAVAVRAGKVFVFVAALVLLGHGFKPVVEAYIVKLPGAALYWINSISAVLDNATLAAAEISPTMSDAQIRDVLIVFIAGGMLIPGNIPNIVSAGKLNITGTEWAKKGVPVGLVLMGACFALLLVV